MINYGFIFSQCSFSHPNAYTGHSVVLNFQISQEETLTFTAQKNA